MYATVSKWYARLRGFLHREHGYTLIELAATTATVGLLVALALPSYNAARQTAAKDEARGFGQEWRQLEWSCFLQQNTVSNTSGGQSSPSGCFNDTNIGFNEAGTNWNFADTAGGNANLYILSPTSGSLGSNLQVIRCAPGRSGSNVAGFLYEAVLTITGTATNPFTGLTVGPGAMYDTFNASTSVTGGTCPNL